MVAVPNTDKHEHKQEYNSTQKYNQTIRRSQLYSLSASACYAYHAVYRIMIGAIK